MLPFLIFYTIEIILSAFSRQWVFYYLSSNIYIKYVENLLFSSVMRTDILNNTLSATYELKIIYRQQ